MFTYSTQIHLRATDATGVLYFPEQFRLAVETLEAFLKEAGLPLKEILKGDYLLPVVHAEADYLAPLEVSDEIDISLQVESIGTSSFKLKYRFFKHKEEVGTATIVHVTVSRETRKSIPIPEELSNLLAHLPCD